MSCIVSSNDRRRPMRRGRGEPIQRGTEMKYDRLLGALLIAAALGATNASAGAQTYPAYVIRIAMGAGAGTPPDAIARIIANEVRESEGWRIVIENKLPAPAASEVLKQPADGHSILAIALAHSAAAALFPNVVFRLDKDFVP